MNAVQNFYHMEISCRFFSMHIYMYVVFCFIYARYFIDSINRRKCQIKFCYTIMVKNSQKRARCFVRIKKLYGKYQKWIKNKHIFKCLQKYI